MSLSNMVVTGANGFIGRHVCQKLIESFKEVTACIREQTNASVFGNLSGPLRLFRMPSLSLGADLNRFSQAFLMPSMIGLIEKMATNHRTHA